MIERLPNPEALFEAAADRVVAVLEAAVAQRGECDLALAGGSTPRALYQRLAAEPRASRIDWSRVNIWFGDERCVPPDHPSSNYRMASESLLRHVPLDPARVHRIEGELGPVEATARYAALRAAAPPLDLVLLGMGDDGHTASLFPGGPELDSAALVVATRSPIAPVDRVSLTLRSIDEAGVALFLVSGAGKAARLAEVFAQREGGSPVLPAARVRAGRVIWLVEPG